MTSRRADAIVPPEEGSVTQCVAPAFPILPGLCTIDAEGDADEDTAGHACSAFTATWFDEAGAPLWSDLHVRDVEALNGGSLDESRDLNYVAFECKAPCTLGASECAYSAETGNIEQRSYHRWNHATQVLDEFTMRRVALVVDGVGARVQYTGDPADTGGTGPFLIVIPGAGGDGGLAAAESIRQWFEIRAGADTAVIDFEAAMPIHYQNSTSEWSGGWQARSSSAPATIGGPLWHDQDFYDLQVFVGGPPMWDINAGCGRMPVAYDLSLVLPPDVPTYGGVYLSTATFCGDELDPSCVPYGPIESWAYVNGVHRLANSAAGCPAAPTFVSDAPLPILTNGSLQSVAAGDWAMSHPIAFFANTDPSQTDDEDLAGPSMVRAYHELRSSHTVGPGEVTWSEAPGRHCAAFKDEPDAHRVRDTITEVLDLDQWMFDLRVDKEVENLFTSTDACLVYDAATGANDEHLTVLDPTIVGGGRFDIGPWISPSNEQATLPSGVTITMPGALGNVVERVMFLTGGSREGTSATARASYVVRFTYRDFTTQDVVVQIPRDDLLSPGTFRGEYWITSPLMGLVGNGGPSCGSGGSVVTVVSPHGYTGEPVRSIQVFYPTNAAQPAYLGGPLALTVWTDHVGLADGAAWPALDVSEYNL